MRKQFVFVLVLLAVTLGCSRKEESVKIVDAWMAAADKVAAESNSEDAVGVMKFIKQRSFVVQAMKSGSSDEIAYKVITGQPSPEYGVAIVCLKEGDADLGGQWKKALEGKNQHAFLLIPKQAESYSILVLKDKGISETWKGILFIHEASHAAAHASRVFENINDLDLRNAYYELLTYELEGKILAELGGEKYQAVLKREMERIAQSYKKNERSASRSDLYQKEMAEIFGAPVSPMEAQLRADALWIIANMAICDLPSDPELALAAKLEILIDCHRNHNVI